MACWRPPSQRHKRHFFQAFPYLVLLCLIPPLLPLCGSLDADLLLPCLLFSLPERQGPQVLSGTQVSFAHLLRSLACRVLVGLIPSTDLKPAMLCFFFPLCPYPMSVLSGSFWVSAPGMIMQSDIHQQSLNLGLGFLRHSERLHNSFPVTLHAVFGLALDHCAV